MNLVEYNARLMDALTTELARPSPERKRPKATPTHYHYTEIDFMSWELEFGYRYTTEPGDIPEVEILTATLHTHPGRYEIALGAFPGNFLANMAATIADEIVAREPEPHRSSCKCRDCRDARGDWEYHHRRENT